MFSAPSGRIGLSGLVLAGWVSACAQQKPPPLAEGQALAGRAKEPQTGPAVSSEVLVSVISLNDLHGRLGALPAFAGYVKALREERGARGAVLVVDAGDMFQGTLGSNRTQGASVVSAYNAIGFAAVALGNHEFDYGPSDRATSPEANLPQGALRARLAEANFFALSANLVDAQTKALPAWQNLRAHVLIDVSGVKLGLLGALTEETPSIVRADAFAGLEVSPMLPAVERSARALRAAGAEAVVLLAHAGGDCRRVDDPNDLSSCENDAEAFALARALPGGLVDAIVAGHTHATVAHFVNGIPIVEALSRGKAFGRVDLRFSGLPRRLVEVRPFPPETLCPDAAELAPCSTHAYAGRAVQPSLEIAQVIGPSLEAARAERKRSIGVEVVETFEAAHGEECPLGNLFTDAMRAHVPDADVAISNAGSLRARLPKGPLSYGSLYECMPFDNFLVKINLSGSELARVLAAHLSRDAHGLVSISGVTARAQCTAGELELKLTRPNGKPVRPDERLVVVTSDYLATGGDRLFSPISLERSRIQSIEKVLVRDVLASELAKRPRLDPKSPDLYRPSHPRLQLPSARPVRCAR